MLLSIGVQRHWRELHKLEAIQMGREAAVYTACVEIVTDIVRGCPRDDGIATTNVRSDLSPDHLACPARIIADIDARPYLQEPNG